MSNKKDVPWYEYEFIHGLEGTIFVVFLGAILGFLILAACHELGDNKNKYKRPITHISVPVERLVQTQQHDN